MGVTNGEVLEDQAIEDEIHSESLPPEPTGSDCGNIPIVAVSGAIMTDSALISRRGSALHEVNLLHTVDIDSFVNEVHS